MKWPGMAWLVLAHSLDEVGSLTKDEKYIFVLQCMMRVLFVVRAAGVLCSLQKAIVSVNSALQSKELNSDIKVDFVLFFLFVVNSATVAHVTFHEVVKLLEMLVALLPLCLGTWVCWRGIWWV